MTLSVSADQEYQHWKINRLCTVIVMDDWARYGLLNIFVTASDGSVLEWHDILGGHSSRSDKLNMLSCFLWCARYSRGGKMWDSCFFCCNFSVSLIFAVILATPMYEIQIIVYGWRWSIWGLCFKYYSTGLLLFRNGDIVFLIHLFTTRN